MFNVSTFKSLRSSFKNEKGEIDYSKEYFGKSTSLVSGQLNAECLAMGLGKRRHLWTALSL